MVRFQTKGINGVRSRINPPLPLVMCICDRSGLSEGEWQRLQLARFLMRADVAKLLLLDEPFKGVSPSESSRMLAALGAQARATGQVKYMSCRLYE